MGAWSAWESIAAYYSWIDRQVATTQHTYLPHRPAGAALFAALMSVSWILSLELTNCRALRPIRPGLTYAQSVRNLVRSAGVGATLIAWILLSACSGSEGSEPATVSTNVTTMPEATVSASPVTPSTSEPAPTASPADESPTVSPANETPSARVDGSPAEDRSLTPKLTLASVDPNSGDVLVGGYVAGLVEAGGTCDFILTRESTGIEIVVSTTSVDNVDTTSCGSAVVKANRVVSGTYSLILKYTHKGGYASSAPVQIEVR